MNGNSLRLIMSLVRKTKDRVGFVGTDDVRRYLKDCLLLYRIDLDGYVEITLRLYSHLVPIYSYIRNYSKSLDLPRLKSIWTWIQFPGDTSSHRRP